MAFSSKEYHLLAIALVCIISLCSFTLLGKADEDSEAGSVNGYLPEAGVVDPGYIVDKALHCFNDKYIYSSCEEAHRLSQSGILYVPAEYTDQYCNGPCLSETHLVLNCLEAVLSHFVFYNKATIHDVRDTIKTGCGYGPGRGDFNVAEHILEEESSVPKIEAPRHLISGLALIIIGFNVLL